MINPVVVLSFLACSVVGQRKNVCTTIPGYLIEDFNKNCYYSPDVYLRASGLITNNGYTFETHYTLTEDGYNLTMFRIFPKAGCTKGIVYLQHPITASCEVWIDKGDRSFAFLLAENGYEVWLGNYRGVSYSLKHIRYSPYDNAFWDWSFHEYGVYDTPAMTDKIRSVTGSKEKFFYFGHSASTSAGLVYASLLPQHAQENYRLITLWAVIAHLEHIPRFLKDLAPFGDYILEFLYAIHSMNLLPHNGLVHEFLKTFCVRIPVNMGVCVGILETLAGVDWENFEPLMFPGMVYHNIEGFSMKVLNHYAQIVTSGGRFQFYDYRRRNVQIYNSTLPPVYPLGDVKVPLFFVCGERDLVGSPEDCQIAMDQVPEEYREGVAVNKKYNHIDHHYAKTAVEELYRPTISMLDAYFDSSCTKFPRINTPGNWPKGLKRKKRLTWK